MLGPSVHDALERSANQTRSTFGSPEVRSRHGCQGAPSPGHRYGCPEASGTRSHSGVGLAEPGDINGDRCADRGHKVIGVSRAGPVKSRTGTDSVRASLLPARSLIADRGGPCQRRRRSRDHPTPKPSCECLSGMVPAHLSDRGHRPDADLQLTPPVVGPRRVCRHYNGQPHRSRPLRSDESVADLSQERIKRRPVLGGLVNEYQRAA